jgi:hypothetical protein
LLGKTALEEDEHPSRLVSTPLLSEPASL